MMLFDMEYTEDRYLFSPVKEIRVRNSELCTMKYTEDWLQIMSSVFSAILLFGDPTLRHMPT